MMNNNLLTIFWLFAATTWMSKTTALIVKNKPPSLRSQTFIAKGLFVHDEFSYDVDSAAIPLSWEVAESNQKKPILDLSSRDVSPEDAAAVEAKNSDSSDWDQGQRWKKTCEKLIDVGFSMSTEEGEEEFLSKCPQLLRLETDMVLLTAEWIVKEFGVRYVQSEPRFLSYPIEDVTYGLELMSTMMMTSDAKPSCLAMPSLFLSLIEEGIRERAVKDALGSASDATYKASQNIAGDAMSSLKQLRNRKLGGPGRQ